jgi:phenylpropionate dioxygenase-like ring-hydroxylating dioxygenase large terminal subunit
MIWLYPSKSPLEALLECGPPRIPELDMKGYKATVAVRDFPIDWTVLMENIMG